MHNCDCDKCYCIITQAMASGLQKPKPEPEASSSQALIGLACGFQAKPAHHYFWCVFAVQHKKGWRRTCPCGHVLCVLEEGDRDMPVVGNKSQYIEKKNAKKRAYLVCPALSLFPGLPTPLGVSCPFLCPFNPCWSHCRISCQGWHGTIVIVSQPFWLFCIRKIWKKLREA